MKLANNLNNHPQIKDKILLENEKKYSDNFKKYLFIFLLSISYNIAQAKESGHVDMMEWLRGIHISNHNNHNDKNIDTFTSKTLNDYNGKHELSIHRKIDTAFSKLKSIEHNITKEGDRSISLAFYEKGEIKTITIPVFSNNTTYQSIHTKEGYNIIVNGDKDIGVNQDYIIINKSGKRLEHIGTKRAPYIGNKYSDEAVYYAPANDKENKEIEGYGMKYLQFIIDSGMEILNDNNYFNDLTEEERKILKDTVLSLFIVEHIDPIRFQNMKSDRHRQGLIKKYLREVGLNRDSTSSYLVNKVGAGGIGQITGKTYDLIKNNIVIKDIPSLDLPHKDTGRKDPIISAIIALIHCNDTYIRIKGNSYYKDNIDLDILQNYMPLLMVDYNAGASRLNQIVKDAIINYQKIKAHRTGYKYRKNRMSSHNKKQRETIIKDQQIYNSKLSGDDIWKLLTREKRTTNKYNKQGETGNYIQKARLVTQVIP